MAAWLPQPVTFDSSHSMSCDGFTMDQCMYYQEHWHNWYVADWAYALPTVAFFMCTIGIFIIGYALSNVLLLLGINKNSSTGMFSRLVAGTRYLTYRGFRIEALGWNSAPVGALLLALVGTIYFFCMDLVPSPYYWPGPSSVWGNSPPLGTRSGWLALACMPFLFATATKSNWVTLVTGVSHEKLQVFHRWIAYAFFVLALMHTFPFIVWHIANGDMVEQFWTSNPFEYWTGCVALIFQAWLTGASWGPIRSLGYEFFKAMHFLSAVVFMVVFFWHCSGTLTSWHYFVATAAVYVPCWAYPWLRTLFEYGRQKAHLYPEANGFTRISIPTNFDAQPGQHCFLRFTSFGLSCMSSHPFTICSLPPRSPGMPAELVFYVRHHKGLTARLHDLAVKRPGASVPVLVDGPYGGVDNSKILDSDRLVIVAGGAGAGWALPFVEQFLRGRCSGPQEVVSTPPAKEDEKSQQASSDRMLPHTRPRRGPKSLRMVLATRDTETCNWFFSALRDTLSSYNVPEADGCVDVQVHLTGAARPSQIIPGLTKSSSDDTSGGEETSSGSEGKDDGSCSGDDIAAAASLPRHTSAKVLYGRPDLPAIIQAEHTSAASARESLGVFVCGPVEMQHHVRNAVAGKNLELVKGANAGEIYLHLEHFSWA